jgi:CheY-like chemotaxis protein
MSSHADAILVVEDSPEDYEATVRALRRADRTVPLVRCVDGDDALDWLRREGAYAGQAPARPLLILLDLNLPGTDGREVLSAIKCDRSLASIPVIILTTSSNPRDVADCYATGANTYVIKPVNLTLFYESVACLVQYWLRVASLPTAEAGRP